MTTPDKRADMADIHLSESRVEDAVADAKVLNEEARLATAAEHSLTFFEALKTYRKAAIWSVCKSTSELTSSEHG